MTMRQADRVYNHVSANAANLASSDACKAPNESCSSCMFPLVKIMEIMLAVYLFQQQLVKNFCAETGRQNSLS